MRSRCQGTKVGIACFILRIEGKPVIGRRNGVRPVWPRNRKQSTDDWLHARGLAGFGEFHDPIKAVAVCDRGGRKAKLPSPFCYALRIDRAFEHRIGGKDSKGNKGRMRHDPVLGGGSSFVNSSKQQNWG